MQAVFVARAHLGKNTIVLISVKSVFALFQHKTVISTIKIKFMNIKLDMKIL